MGQTTDQIKDEIDSQRQALGSNLQELEDKVKTTVDWRSQFEQRPMAGVGLAFAGGFLLSALMPSGSKESSGSSYDVSDYRVRDESGASRASFSSGSKPKSPEMNEISETINNVRGAVMGLAATRLRTFLAETVPGFQDEYEEARRKRGASDASKIDTVTSSGSRPSSFQTSASPAPSQTLTATQPGTHEATTPLSGYVSGTEGSTPNRP